MASIKSKNSEAEKHVFRYLREQGIYFQKHYTKVAGKPDVALPRKKIAVFVDGDFWHGRDYKRVLNVTKNKYWVDKIAKNMNRDKSVNDELREKGWKILRIWESDVNRKRTRDETLSKIKDFLIQ